MCMERTILLKYLKIYLDIDLKNFVELSKLVGNSWISNVVKSFDILAISLSVLIILMI